jgi:formylglycine-generating enzyme required for sulfatase activity
MKKVFLSSATMLLIVLLSSFAVLSKKPFHQTKHFKNAFAYAAPAANNQNNQAIQLGNYNIANHEVSNAEYFEFLTALKAEGRTEEMSIAQIDSAQWETVFKSNPMTTYYHQHPAYRNYPVVNITYEAAQLYCQWLTRKYNSDKALNYIYEFRLPQCGEWMRAAEGKLSKVDYAWGGSSVFNPKNCVLCNIDVNQENNGLTDATTYTTMVESYSPDSIGLYNMNGNVAEMTSKKGEALGGSWKSTAANTKISSVETYNSASPLIGFRPVLTVTAKAIISSKV